MYQSMEKLKNKFTDLILIFSFYMHLSAKQILTV